MCNQFEQVHPILPPDVTGPRLEAIFARQKEWANGTVLKYYLYNQRTKDGARAGKTEELDAVRSCFAEWKAIGIGLEFSEVAEASEAELRVAFVKDGRSWSYVGRDNLTAPGIDQPTMNLGWDVVADRDTILHEIGHALGLNHEHQNPNAGIIWDEAKVIEKLSGHPNYWDIDTIRRNVLNKLPQSTVRGGDWDKDSVMHYSFEAGLISVPETYRTKELKPKGGLSAADKKWAATVYPPIATARIGSLSPHKSALLSSKVPGQTDFRVAPTETRVFHFQKFGESDGVMVLFEEIDGQNWYLQGDDDAGKSTNAKIEARLRAGREYTLRVKTHYAPDPNSLSVMMW